MRDFIFAAEEERGVTFSLISFAGMVEDPLVVRAVVLAGEPVSDYGPHDGLPELAARSKTLAEVLLRAGMDANARTYLGETALFYASDPAVVRVLLDAGADVNARDNAGNTPLFHSILEHEPGLLAVLIAAGADVNAKNRDGKTPYAVFSWAVPREILLKAGVLPLEGDDAEDEESEEESEEAFLEDDE